MFAIFNLTDNEQTVTLNGTLYTGRYRDVFAGDSILFDDSAQVIIPAWGYEVFEIGSGITGVEKDEEIVKGYSLSQNYPNPFNPETNFEFRTADFGFVTLKIYDVLGNEAAVLVNEEKPAGRYQINFNAASLSSGIYFYVINVNGYTAARKMLLIK